MAMKLSLLLYALKLKLKLCAFMSSTFRDKLKEKDCVLVIRTADRKQSRSFCFTKGRMTSKRGGHPAPDTELVWDDAATAFAIMSSDEETAILEAIGKSQLKIEGNLEFAFWFTEIAK